MGYNPYTAGYPSGNESISHQMGNGTSSSKVPLGWNMLSFPGGYSLQNWIAFHPLLERPWKLVTIVSKLG